MLEAFVKRYRRKTPWQFCWRVALEGTVASAIVLVPLLASGASTRDMPNSIESFVVEAVLVAPWLETLLFQSLPIGLCRLLGLSTSTQAIASVVPFCLAHLPLGVAPGIAAGLVGGFYFAFTYLWWRRRDWWTAFWVTSVSHAIRNGIASFLLLVGT
jgi:hypothetical protein